MVRGISIEPNYVRTVKSKMGSKNASDFASSKCNSFLGMGFSGHCPFFDPTMTAEDSRRVKLSQYFSHSNEDIDKHCRNIINLKSVKAYLRESLVVYNDLSKVSEVGASTFFFSPLQRNLTVQEHLVLILM